MGSSTQVGWILSNIFDRADNSPSTMNIGLENGGTAGMIYMFIFAWVGATCVYASLSELASMAPISAGQYFWVAMLAPRSSQKFLSYLTGMLDLLSAHPTWANVEFHRLDDCYCLAGA